MQTQFDIYLIILVITFIYGLVSFKKLSSPYRMLFVLVTYVFFSELVIRFVLPSIMKYPSIAYHITVVVLISLYTLIYFRIFESDIRLKRLVLGLGISFGGIAILNSLFYQGLYLIPSFSIAAHGILCISLSLLLFKKMIETPSELPLAKQPEFWFNIGTLSFYSFSFIGFLFYNEYELEKLTVWLFYLNVIGNWILYLCYLVSFYLNKKANYER